MNKYDQMRSQSDARLAKQDKAEALEALHTSMIRARKYAEREFPTMPEAAAILNDARKVVAKLAVEAFNA